MERKPATRVVPIRPAAVGSPNQPDPPPACGAHGVPPTGQRSTSRERRSNRMLQPAPEWNREAAQLNESVAINSGIPFLEQTRDDICYRFLRGTDERRIAESLSSRHYSVARVDIERVIRAGFAQERERRIRAERTARAA